MATAALLEVRDLSVAFRTDRGEVEAVSAASLTVHPGQTVAVVGESGSGKSTLTAAVNRLLAPNGRVTGGSVTFAGQDLLARSERQMNAVRGKQIGLVPQDPMSNLNPLRSVGSQIAEVFTIHKEARGREAKRRAVELLERVGITDAARRYAQYPHEFSGGMRQRVLIAMGLALRPQLLIADEPTSALDVTVQKRVLDQMAELTATMGTAVLLVTHDLALAAERADHVVVMRRGQVVEQGSVHDVLTTPTADYTRLLIAAAPSLATESLVGPAAVTDPVVEVRGLRKEYAVRSGPLGRRTPFTAVDDVAFTIPRGTTVGIVGESGSGKSTVAKMVLKLEDVTAGDLLFEGRSVTGISGAELFAFRRRVQPVFQNPYAALDSRYTVGDTVREPLDVHGVGTPAERRAKVAELLSQVALDPSSRGATRTSCPAASGSGSPSPAPWPWSPTSSSSTRRCRRWTCWCRPRSSSCWSPCSSGSGSATCSSATTSPSSG